MKRFTQNLLILLVVTFLFQTFLILYNHIIGYSMIKNPQHFLISVAAGTVLSTFLGLVLLNTNRKIIHVLNVYLSWHEHTIYRICSEFFAAVVVGITGGILISGISHLLFTYSQPLPEVFFKNGLIVLVINLIFMTLLEAVYFYQEKTEVQHKAERLEKEMIELKFETLKKQLDPHFLFNSLNVLSSLISSDPEKAQIFIERFSSVYRYTLDVIEKPIVSLRDELTFAQSYLFLQNLRFNNTVLCVIEGIDPPEEAYIPPLSLQLLLENAMKHNEVSAERPLHISITIGVKSVSVKNTLNKKAHPLPGRRLGLDNLRHRYTLISLTEPEITQTDDSYSVTLPYIKN